MIYECTNIKVLGEKKSETNREIYTPILSVLQENDIGAFSLDSSHCPLLKAHFFLQIEDALQWSFANVHHNHDALAQVIVSKESFGEKLTTLERK